MTLVWKRTLHHSLTPHLRGPKTEADKFFYGALTEKIIACAITVHKELGPGFLEKIYEEALIDGKVVVELKAVKEIDDAHLATCLSYLKATRLRVGFITNFSQAQTRIKQVMRADDFLTTEKGSEEDREGS